MHPCDNAETLLRVLSAPRRNHYFYGKRMDVQHFQMEQDYGKHKQWLLNRLTLGKGVICGLKVSIDGDRLCVEPGVAIDGLGREIVVPIRQCIDPNTNDGGCCVPCCEDPKATPALPDSTIGNTPSNHGNNASDDHEDREEREDARRLYTLWLCYKECKTDFQPVLVSECGTRQPCAAGTIVESFCLKVAPGAPLQQDPDWCAHLWKRKEDPPAPGNSPASADDFTSVPPPAPASPAVSHHTPGAATPVGGATGSTMPSDQELRASLDSRQRILCSLFGDTCDVDEGDACVPLGVFALRDKRVTRFDACLVRPRIYSNAMLLDLILCLADKIDDCCNHQEPTPPPPPPALPMRLTKIDFLNRAAAGGEAVIVTMTDPLQDTLVNIGRNVNALRISFTQAFAQDQHVPTAPGINDPDFKRHNVLIIPDDVLNNVPYVAGSLTIEGPDTVRFDLSRESPYFRRQGGWQKGRYRVLLRGNENLPSSQQALANTAGAPFDGEPITLAGGVISGDNTAGGDFVGAFLVSANG